MERTLVHFATAALMAGACLLASGILAGGCGGSSDGGTTGGDADVRDVGVADIGGLVQDVPAGGDATGGDAAGGDATGDGSAGGDAASDTGAREDGASPDDASGPEDVPGFEYPCEPGDEQACVTACGSAGVQTCWKDWGPCVPPDEFCGNCSDDDCDGAVDEGCPGRLGCQDPDPPPDCPVAVITIAEGQQADTGETLHLTAADSRPVAGAEIDGWQWSVATPPGAAGAFDPGADVQAPTFPLDVAGTYVFSLDVWDEFGTESCQSAQAAVVVVPFPPVDPEVGCADGGREGFLDLQTFTRIAGCAGAWSVPGVTPDGIAPTCGRDGGDDGGHRDGAGCSSADLCAAGWHVCETWHEVAAASPSGCVGATPPDAPSKSLFFAIRQPSENYSKCGEWGDGFNDVFGCGNLGHGLPGDRDCGPLDRVLASTQPNSCGFNEAEPNLGPWQCLGPDDSHLNEGALVTKVGCPDTSCQYDGHPIANWDKGGVLCCRD